jgi:hypothetical protein
MKNMILALAIVASGCSAYHKAPCAAGDQSAECSGHVSMSGGPATAGVHYMGAETAQQAVGKGGYTSYSVTTRSGTTTLTHSEYNGLGYYPGFGGTTFQVSPSMAASAELSALRAQQRTQGQPPFVQTPPAGETPSAGGACPTDREPVTVQERLACLEGDLSAVQKGDKAAKDTAQAEQH